MILTGKAKEDFLYWNHHIKDNDHGIIDIEPTSLSIGFSELYESLQYTLIIEWFDSVGIFITIDCTSYHMNEKKFESIYDYTICYYARYDANGIGIYKSRQEATEQAIIKANLIYNERK